MKEDVSIRIVGDATKITRKEFLDLCLEALAKQQEKARQKGFVSGGYFRSLVNNMRERLTGLMQKDVDDWTAKQKESLGEVAHPLYFKENAPLPSALVAYILDIRNEKGEYSLGELDNYAEALKATGWVYEQTERIWRDNFHLVNTWALVETPFDDTEFSNGTVDKKLRKRITEALVKKGFKYPPEIFGGLTQWYTSLFPFLLMRNRKIIRPQAVYGNVSAERAVIAMADFLERKQTAVRKKRKGGE